MVIGGLGGHGEIHNATIGHPNGGLAPDAVHALEVARGMFVVVHVRNAAGTGVVGGVIGGDRGSVVGQVSGRFGVRAAAAGEDADRPDELLVDVDAEAVAALTPGFAGADLANLVNEAALVATRRRASEVTMADFTAEAMGAMKP